MAQGPMLPTQDNTYRCPGKRTARQIPATTAQPVVSPRNFLDSSGKQEAPCTRATAVKQPVLPPRGIVKSSTHSQVQPSAGAKIRSGAQAVAL